MTLVLMPFVGSIALASVQYEEPRATIYIDSPCDFTVNGEPNPGCEPPSTPGGGGSTSGGSNGGSGSSGSGTGTGGSGSSNPNFILWKTDTLDADDFDLDELDDCFEMVDNGDLDHTITVFIDQPIDNSDALRDGDRSVGHVWIGIEQTNSDGSSTFRNFGLYPTEEDAISTGGQIKTETMKPFDVAVTYDISPSEFRDLIADVQSRGTPAYHAFDYNSTDYAIQTVGFLGFSRLDAEKYYNRPTGNGYQYIAAPGPLGEAVRAVPPLDAAEIDTDGGFSLGNPPCQTTTDSVHERD